MSDVIIDSFGDHSIVRVTGKAKRDLVVEVWDRDDKDVYVSMWDKDKEKSHKLGWFDFNSLQSLLDCVSDVWFDYENDRLEKEGTLADMKEN